MNGRGNEPMQGDSLVLSWPDHTAQPPETAHWHPVSYPPPPSGPWQDMGEAVRKHADVDVMINFASFRSVYPSTMEALSHPQLRTIAIIAEGVPEIKTRQLIREVTCRLALPALAATAPSTPLCQPETPVVILLPRHAPGVCCTAPPVGRLTHVFVFRHVSPNFRRRPSVCR